MNHNNWKSENGDDVTRVIFRKYAHNVPDYTLGDIVALFPDLEAGDYQSYNADKQSFETRPLITSYEHIGQHGQADYSHVMSITDEASPDEFKPLLDELTTIGYHCFIVNKREDIL